MPTLALPELAVHPALAGHFPTRPIVPGVVLLDQAQLCVEAATGETVAGIAMAKFVSPAGPADVLWLDYEVIGRTVRFDIRAADRKIASGRFNLKDRAPA